MAEVVAIAFVRDAAFENGVLAHGRLGGNERLRTIRLLVDDFAVVANANHRARNQAGPHGFLDLRVNFGAAG